MENRAMHEPTSKDLSLNSEAQLAATNASHQSQSDAAWNSTRKKSGRAPTASAPPASGQVSVRSSAQDSSPMSSPGRGKHDERPPFDLSGTSAASLGDYNPLLDNNLGSYLSQRSVQKRLYRLGFVDRSGRVLDLGKTRSKIARIEAEYRDAQKDQQFVEREAAERRHRMKKAEEMLREEEERKARAHKIREEERIARETRKIRMAALEGRVLDLISYRSPAKENRSQSAGIIRPVHNGS
eukprot:ANDGO_06415.mRNA.1 hypothetical protein H257_11578